MIVPFADRRPIYWIGDIVYLRIADESKRGIVVGILIRQASLLYAVVWPDGAERYHTDFELSSQFVPDYGPSQIEGTL